MYMYNYLSLKFCTKLDVLSLSHYVFIYTCRYNTLMLSCWNEDPKERLAFSDMAEAIESILMEVAEYLDFSEYVVTVNENDNNDEDWQYQEKPFPSTHHLSFIIMNLNQELFMLTLWCEWNAHATLEIHVVSFFFLMDWIYKSIVHLVILHAVQYKRWKIIVKTVQCACYTC